MTISATTSLPAQLLTPRAYFKGLVVVCTLTLGATLAIQTLSGISLGELGRFQQVSYSAVILLGSLGILLRHLLGLDRGRELWREGKMLSSRQPAF